MASHLIPHQIITSLLSHRGYLLWVNWSLVLCQWEFVSGIDSMNNCPFSDVSIQLTQGFAKKRHIIEYNYPRCSSTESLSLLLKPPTQHQVNDYIFQCSPVFLCENCFTGGLYFTRDHLLTSPVHQHSTLTHPPFLLNWLGQVSKMLA